jgi:hypothetical protein
MTINLEQQPLPSAFVRQSQDELVKMILKLRWIGMFDEAGQLQHDLLENIPCEAELTPSVTLWQLRDASRISGKIENMEAGVRAVDHVYVAALVGLHIVALDRGLATFLTVDLDAAFVCSRSDRRDEVTRLLRMIRIAHVKRAHARIEECYEGELLIEDRRHTLI